MLYKLIVLTVSTTLIVIFAQPNDAPAEPCVPAAGVAYDGLANVWRDADGNGLIFAIQEDTLPACDGRWRGTMD